MTKQTKTVKCPQCGNIQKVQPSDDNTIHCDKCGAECVTNNDVATNADNDEGMHTLIKIFKVLGAVAIVFVLVFFISSIVSMCSEAGKKKGVYDAWANEKEHPFRDIAKESCLQTKDNKILYFSLNHRTFEDKEFGAEFNGFYYTFRDIVQGSILKDDILIDTGSDPITGVIDSKYRYFSSSGKHYILLNKRDVYEINFNTLTLDEVTSTVLPKTSEFESGVASMEFINEDQGDGFKVLTKSSEEFYYYPSINKIYESVGEKMQGISSLLPDAKDITYYAFTEKSEDYPDEKVQLLRIVYKYNNGGPELKITNPGWHKHYEVYGIIDQNTPFTKQLIDKDQRRVVSYEDITSQREYISPELLYFDKDYILICFSENATSQSPKNIQLLDSNANIVWTQPLEADVNRKDAVRNDNYFAINAGEGLVLLVSIDGKEIKKVKLSD